MKLSRYNLDRLYEWQFDEYKNLLKRENRYKNFIIAVSLVIFVITYSTGCYYLISYSKDSKDLKDLMGCFVVAAFYLFFVFAGGVITASEVVFEYIYKKTKSCKRSSDLAQTYLPIKKIVEKEIADYINHNLKPDVRHLRKNLSNIKTYPNLIDDFQNNYFFIVDATVKIGTIALERQYRRILKSENIWFEDGTLNIKPKKDSIYQSKPQSIQSKKNRNPLSILSDTFNTKTNTSSPQNQNNTIQSNLKAQDAPPPPKIKRRKEAIGLPIKMSKENWAKINQRNMNIGEKGELLVMDYERKRLLDEEGSRSLFDLEHSSKIQGEGLGYDIRSIKKGKPIFIEVKTTTSSFWTDLFFTDNEKKVMQEFDDKFYLYRVYEFNELENTGKLTVFEGREAIEYQFDFIPQRFVLRAK